MVASEAGRRSVGCSGGASSGDREDAAAAPKTAVKPRRVREDVPNSVAVAAVAAARTAGLEPSDALKCRALFEETLVQPSLLLPLEPLALRVWAQRRAVDCSAETLPPNFAEKWEQMLEPLTRLVAYNTSRRPLVFSSSGFLKASLWRKGEDVFLQKRRKNQVRTHAALVAFNPSFFFGSQFRDAAAALALALPSEHSSVVDEDALYQFALGESWAIATCPDHADAEQDRAQPEPPASSKPPAATDPIDVESSLEPANRVLFAIDPQ